MSNQTILVFLKSIIVDHTFYSDHKFSDFRYQAPFQLNFGNLAFHEFLTHYVPRYSTRQYRINGSNLKLLGQSKVLCENLREVYQNQFNLPFKIDLKELLTVIDDPSLPARMVSIRDENYFDLWRFDTFERLERLEHVLGRPVSDLIYQSYDYFKHRTFSIISY